MNYRHLTPAFNAQVIEATEKLYKESNGQTEVDFNKCFDMVLLRWGLKPDKYHAAMAEICYNSQSTFED